MHASSLLLLLLALAAPLAAQGSKPAPPATTKEDEDVLKAGPKDPFTDADPAAMAAAGVVAYGPFPWADHHRTADIDRVLGEGRILWLETAHCRIGCNLKSVPLPVEQSARKALLDEIKLLHKKLPKVPDKPKKLDPWLRLHLYAQRAEDLYARFQALLGVSDADFTGTEPPDGKYLGLPDKFLLLLFQKKSDLARYLDRFCGVQGEVQARRHYHRETCQMLFAVAVDGIEQFDECALHSHVVYSLLHNFLSGYRGYAYELPLWFSEGLAHWYSRPIETDFINVGIRDDEAVNDEDKHEWAKKVRLRAQHDGAWLKFAQMVAWKKFDEMGYQAHIQSWSRVDWLMSLGADKVGALVRELKSLSAPRDGLGVQPDAILRAQANALLALWGLDSDTFDQRWREWVLKTYPKK